MALDKEEKTKLFCGLGCFTFLISLVLFGMSFSVVEVLEHGVIINENTMEVNAEKTYDSGRYFVGLGYSFLKFPSDYQTLRFGTYGWLTKEESITGNVECRTFDKMQLFVEVTAQFQISGDPHDLVRLYYDFGEYGDEDLSVLMLKNMKKTYAAMGLKVFRNVISKYLSTEIVQKRNEIETKMKEGYDLALQRLYSTIVTLEILNFEFDLGSKYADAIERTQVAKQQIKEMENRLLVAGVKSKATAETSNLTAQILISQANAYSSSLLATSNADATALIYKTEAQVQAYNTLKSELGLNSTAALMNYLWMNSVTNEAKAAIAMPYPATIGQ